jgi:hypothetical protein
MRSPNRPRQRTPVRGRGRAIWKVFAPFTSMIVPSIVPSLILFRLLRR